MQTTIQFSQTDSETYDRLNPEVWRYFKLFSFQMIDRGYKRIGSKMIFERIRWETMITGDGTFKINNNYTPYYARKFEQEFPEHSGIFAMRESHLDGVEN